MAVYEFDWNCGGLPFKKLRLMVMQMTRSPLQILAAPFFELDFNLFFSVSLEGEGAKDNICIMCLLSIHRCCEGRIQ